MKSTFKPLRGVNLGGWLVLEPWITPSLFKDNGCVDEYSLSHCLGADAEASLNKFRSAFITKDDFKWIAEQGMNAVRLPLGHWVLAGQRPYVSTAPYVDKAMNWAQECGLRVIFSLHGAPGSQNGKNHSGQVGSVGWHKNQANIQLSLEVVKLLASRYKNNPSLTGIELLNEPHWTIPRRVLNSYYSQAYGMIRGIAGENVAILINDHYKPGFWKKFTEKNGYKNIFVDRHIYQAYKRDSKRDVPSLLRKTVLWRNQILNAQKTSPVIIGEWSIALHHESRALNLKGRDAVFPQYSQAQLNAFTPAAGWFYWTYKTEDKGPWNFRTSVENGWIKI